MDIDLTLVFASTVVIAVICIISTILTHNRLAKLETKSVEKADLAMTEIDNGVSKLLDLVTKKIQDLEESSTEIAKEQQLQVGKNFEDSLQALQNLQKEIKDSFERQLDHFTDEKTKLVSRLDETLFKMNESSKKGLESLSKSTEEAAQLIATALKRTEATLNDHFTEENTKLVSSLDETLSKMNESSKKGLEYLSKSTEEAAQLITTALKCTEVTLNDHFTEGNTKLVSSLGETLSKMDVSSKKGFDSLSTSTKEAAQLMVTELKLTEVNLNNSIIDLGKEQHKVAFVNNQNQLSNFETLTTLLQSIRIDNIIELTNELGKHKKLTVETEDFVKKLGDCKVLTIEDKFTGQITQVYYENGIKRSTDTFSGEHLKYQMFFDEDGKASRGVELNTEGNIAFEYLYNEVGEVSKRIEHTYDDSGSVQKIEKSY